jgi:hypothetical protein
LEREEAEITGGPGGDHGSISEEPWVS